tara:strand:+ start:2050 stop:3984 length:1935 start_codon:yes stop_codon:yes gene_type:complete
MLKYSLTLIFTLSIYSINIFSQTYLDLAWSDEITEIKSDYNTPLIGLFSKHYIEYYESKFSDEIFIYETHHFKSIINNNIDEINNEIIIPKLNILEVSDVKAKIISNESIKLYDFQSIKSFKDDSLSNDNFIVYELPEIKQNDIIEVMYTVKKNYNFNGSKNIQESYPILSADFILIQDNLTSNIKVYNAKNYKIKDTLISGKNAKFINFSKIKESINEQYATPIANKLKVSYQCYSEQDNSTQNEYWGNLVTNVSELFFPKSINKKAEELLKEIKNGYVTIPWNELKIANSIDTYIKKNFIISDKKDQKLNNIDHILEQKESNDFSIIQVYTQLLKLAEIEYEIAISCNRFYLKFDPDFFDPNQLREFLIYIPKSNVYISPNRIEYRATEAPDDLTGNYAMFIDKNLDYYFSEIILENKGFSEINKDIKINISRNLKKSIINEKRYFTGYWGILNRNYVFLSENEKTDFLIDYFTISGLNDKKIIKYKINNYDIDYNFKNEPLEITSKLETKDLISRVNGKILLNVGKVIGLQSNLFKEVERVNPIEINFPNEYSYEIEFLIPKGYKVLTIDNLIKDRKYISVDGNVTAQFKSSANIVNNKLTIKISEYYKSFKYEKNRYNEFRDVINTAAEFYESNIELEKN